jgi:hypothetical protein
MMILRFDLAFLHSHWKFLDATVFKAKSCEKFEAKISEKSEKKRSEYLKRTSESHVKWISVRLLFALKRKNFFMRNGLTLIPTGWVSNISQRQNKNFVDFLLQHRWVLKNHKGLR